MEPLGPLDDAEAPMVAEGPSDTNDNMDMRDDFDTFNFHQEVDEELGNGYVDYEGDDIIDDSAGHIMSPLMDVLQTLGVDAVDATNFCVNVIKNQPVRPMSFGKELWK